MSNLQTLDILSNGFEQRDTNVGRNKASSQPGAEVIWRRKPVAMQYVRSGVEKNQYNSPGLCDVFNLALVSLEDGTCVLCGRGRAGGSPEWFVPGSWANVENVPFEDYEGHLDDNPVAGLGSSFGAVLRKGRGVPRHTNKGQVYAAEISKETLEGE